MGLSKLAEQIMRVILARKNKLVILATETLNEARKRFIWGNSIYQRKKKYSNKKKIFVGI